ncbi:nucleoside-diphosphate kinase [Monocercomonoides exilis]|uniref:nucleoside-diphosphate kinase n=1 Tax=Monocercomonoides exilis TaxID=2049356 RepID=UPI0035593ED6|nr:nucleoside-diphosphate kinase [Monocercomonoides exilis]|eukprot:MONOS_7456.1-p1 / transcript=MONOS_7456.1 / gene=MONOS_7456 / organism=Monocercomonoides_exilis_PA203 / gene_product=nucleoside-diphosphate kinase [EC:2.7.4.6] / transcript_product=nucleoside-diphosphate kinase [EC:2.7.4.6] / location=Mono_scaffold00255:34550-36308(+) / protein_length=413 / sequence_SO=supercontig / SO=protein_coding / is_pseudo=false
MFTSHLHDPKDLRYSFYVVWFDALASLNREYALLYYTVDNTVEMIDRKTKKTFLKRSSYPDVKLENLFVGSTIVIFGRQLKIVEYADQATREALTKAKEHAFILVRPEAFVHSGEILNIFHQNKLIVAKLKTAFLSDEEAEKLFDCRMYTSGSASSISSSPQSSRSPLTPYSPHYAEYCASASCGLCLAMELVGCSAISLLQELVGNPSFEQAKRENPKSLIARFGKGESRPGLYVSPTLEKSKMDSELILDIPRMPTAQLRDCTTALVYPHAINEGKLGPIIQEILDKGFIISCISHFQLNKSTAGEFFEVYETVIPEYPHIVDEACNGLCVAMEVVLSEDLKSKDSGDADIVQLFRDLCGPADPVVAKTLRPHSLRAMFGNTRVQNAIHCTDLSEDGVLESEYFFSILQE